MGFFSKLTKLAIDVVTTPIAIAADVVTMGGELTDQKKSYTAKKLENIQDDFEEMQDEL